MSIAEHMLLQSVNEPFSSQDIASLFDVSWSSDSVKHILIVVHGYPPQHTGGAEQRAERTARALQKRGYGVRVLCFEQYDEASSSIHWSDSIQDDVPVRRLACPCSPKEESFHESYNNPHMAMALNKLLQEWQPDLVYLVSGYLMSASIVWVAKMYKLPVVIALTDYWWLCHRINLLNSQGQRCSGPDTIHCTRCLAESYRRFRLPAQVVPPSADWLWHTARSSHLLQQVLGVDEQKQRADFLMETLQMADRLISPSQFLANVYIGYGVRPEQIHVSRQGVELNVCPLHTPSPILRIGYLGQMKSHKGVHLLLEAWGKLRGSRARQLTLYGSHMGEDSYAQLITQHIGQLRDVYWAGHVVGAQIWDVLAELDVIVVPSRWVENSPNIILEAQALGIPVIGTNLGGIAELVHHEQNGLLFEVDNSDDLARQLQRVLDEPTLLSALQQKPHPFMSKEGEIDQLVQHFTSVLQPHEREVGAL